MYIYVSILIKFKLIDIYFIYIFRIYSLYINTHYYYNKIYFWLHIILLQYIHIHIGSFATSKCVKCKKEHTQEYYQKCILESGIKSSDEVKSLKCPCLDEACGGSGEADIFIQYLYIHHSYIYMYIYIWNYLYI